MAQGSQAHVCKHVFKLSRYWGTCKCINRYARLILGGLKFGQILFLGLLETGAIFLR